MPPPPADVATEAGRLHGWKAIAGFLRVDVRTARRWEVERALPVHRLPGDARSPVWADRSELAAWLRSPDAGSSAPPAPADQHADSPVDPLTDPPVAPPAPAPTPASPIAQRACRPSMPSRPRWQRAAGRPCSPPSSPQRRAATARPARTRFSSPASRRSPATAPRPPAGSPAPRHWANPTPSCSKAGPSSDRS